MTSRCTQADQECEIAVNQVAFLLNMRIITIVSLNVFSLLMSCPSLLNRCLSLEHACLILWLFLNLFGNHLLDWRPLLQEPVVTNYHETDGELLRALLLSIGKKGGHVFFFLSQIPALCVRKHCEQSGIWFSRQRWRRSDLCLACCGQ